MAMNIIFGLGKYQIKEYFERTSVLTDSQDLNIGIDGQISTEIIDTGTQINVDNKLEINNNSIDIVLEFNSQ